MPLSEKLANVIDKFLDNANVGKFVTDVGPGFALSVSLLMLIGMAGNISVVPADRSALLVRRIYGPEAAAAIDTGARRGPDEEYAPLPRAVAVKCAPEPAASQGTASAAPLHATAEVHREIEALCLVLKEAGAKGIGVSDPGNNLTEDAVYRFARRTVADLGARIESLDTQRSTRLKQASPPPAAADLDKIGLEKGQLSPTYERIVAQKEAVDEARERLATLRNELTDSRSFARNIQVFTDNSGTLLVFAIVLGVLLSQISRLVFVNLLYDRWLPKAEQTSQAEALRADERTARQADELVTDYYRYVEGSINMVLPTLLFGLAFCFFVRERFAGYGTWLPPTAVVACTLLSVGLVFAGYCTYRDYRKKLTRLVAGAPPQAGEAHDKAA